MDIYEATNSGPFTPIPHVFTYGEAMDIDRFGQGVRFFFPEDEEFDDEMSYRSLEYRVRTDARFGFDGADTIEETGSHDDAELWSDVIVPAIVDGRIEYAVWGIVQNLRDERNR